VCRIIYPHSYPDYIAAGRTEAELLDILKYVHLAYLPDREGGLDTRKEWKDVLSGGEKQRVSSLVILASRIQTDDVE
jgi:ATP-binding cassette subfamily D (ALD) long-chain fatty acid import protein